MESTLDTMSGLLYTIDMGRSSAKGRQNAVRRARRALDMTQAELAEWVGVSRQTVVAIENGGYAPSVYLALALSETLGPSVEALFGRQAESNNGRQGAHDHGKDT
jgi:putative transcriptional regulator